MIFKPYYRHESGCASYLFGCGTLGTCAVVDPIEPFLEEYLQFAEAKGMRITYVLDTHVHADHRSAFLRASRSIRGISPAPSVAPA